MPPFDEHPSGAPEPAMPLAASAWAGGRGAARIAAQRAVAGLRGAEPALVLVFPETGPPADEAVAEASAAAPGCPVAGMTSEGLLTDAGVRREGCGAIAFGPELTVGVGLARDASADLRAAGRAAASAAVDGLDLRAGHAAVLLFVDPTSGDEGVAIDGAYDVAGGRIPLAGGGANGGAPRVIAGGEAIRDGVVAVALSAPAPVAVGMAHGCRPLAEPAIATRTDGRALLELNGRPAERVYLEGLGRLEEPLDDREFEALAVLHPLAQPELRGALRLRHIRGRAPGGGLACATRIPPNAAVWLTEQTEETIVASARDAVYDTLALLPGPARAALVFDCAARKRALGDVLAEEARALVSAFGDIPALMGLYTRGEVGRTRGAKGDRNHAVVVVAFA